MTFSQNSKKSQIQKKSQNQKKSQRRQCSHDIFWRKKKRQKNHARDLKKSQNKKAKEKFRKPKNWLEKHQIR